MKTVPYFILLSCLFNLSAQDFSLKITPSVYGEGRFYFAGQEQKNGNTVATEGDAEARIKAELDYKQALGVIIELEGDFNSTNQASQASLGFGDNAYAYVHILKIFGIDARQFDIYLRGGRFEVEFQNAQHAGDDDWKADVAALARDNKINMQLDFKLLDMLTLRYAMDFNSFEKRPVNDPIIPLYIDPKRQRVELSKRLDMGWGLLFEKTFGKHKIQASLAYSVDISPNRGAFEEDSTQNDRSYFTKEPRLTNFDQMGLSVAYTSTFGRIAIKPFLNLTLSSVLHKPYGAYHHPLWTWSAGGKFAYQDENNNYDIFGLGIDFDGSLRKNRNYRDIDNKERKGIEYIENKGFTGMQIKAWSHFLRGQMGKNYLSFWGKVRFEFWTPDLNLGGSILERESILASWGLKLEQRIITEQNASVKIIAELTMKNLAPFSAKDNGYYGGLDASGSYLSERQDEPFQVYLDLGIDASFTGSLKF